jgi:hypothetical protein
MKRLARFVLLFLLGATLPLHSAHGVSMAQRMALSMVHHGAAHHAASQTAVTAARHDAHRPGADGGSGHQHQHAAAGQPQEHAGLGDGAADAGGPHCGACTACCTSVGLTGALPVVAQPEGYDALVPLPEHPLASIPPSRLERPPLAA